MKKPAAVGGTDKLRALTEDPELRPLMEPYFAAPPGAREPALTAFIEKVDALNPDWRDTWEAKLLLSRHVKTLRSVV